jgi:nitrate/nitrite transport system permease protein
MGERVIRFMLPVVGVVFLLMVWTVLSANVPDLPSPVKTWEESKIYILQPLEKRGEMDQGIVRLASYSLVRVAKGFLLGIAIATPLGFILGLSKTFNRMFDPVIQVLRPISPLAWLPLGLIIFRSS